MTDGGIEESVSTLIKNVDSMFALAMINWSWSAISEQKMMCCYIVKFKGYILVYPLTYIHKKHKLITYLIWPQKETFSSPQMNVWLYGELIWIFSVAGLSWCASGPGID